MCGHLCEVLLFVCIAFKCVCFGPVFELGEADLDVVCCDFSREVLCYLQHLLAVVIGFGELEVKINIEHSLFNSGACVNVVFVAREKSLEKVALAADFGYFV